MTFELLFDSYKICGMKGYALYYYRTTPNSIMTSKIDPSSIEDLDIRCKIYTRLLELQGVDKVKKKFTDNTKNIFIDTVVRIRFSDKNIKPFIKELKKCRDRLHKEVFFPEAINFSEKIDCFIMKLSLRLYRLYKLVQVNVFKIQVYKY